MTMQENFHGEIVYDVMFLSVSCPGSALSYQEIWPLGRHQTGQQVQQALSKVTICLLSAGKLCCIVQPLILCV